jgi:hypothetical protein
LISILPPSFQVLISFFQGLISTFPTLLFHVGLKAVCALQRLLMIDKGFDMQQLSFLFHHGLEAKVYPFLNYQGSLV